MFAYLEKSQHVNGMTGETTDVAVETQAMAGVVWEQPKQKDSHTSRNCPKNKHPLLSETLQRKHLTHNMCPWQDTRTVTAWTPVRKSLVNCFSLSLLRISIFFPISHMLGGGEVSKGFC